MNKKKKKLSMTRALANNMSAVESMHLNTLVHTTHEYNVTHCYHFFILYQYYGG